MMAEKNENLSIVSVKDMLSDNLIIPGYQRPYRWSTESALTLITDTFSAFQNKISEYRIGSVVLHRADGKMNIVDGQQRLTTLSIMLFCFYKRTKNEDYKKISKLLDAEYNELSTRAIISNYETIMRKVSEIEDGILERYISYVLNECTLVKIITDSEQEAFQFFDSQNSRGKELAPHDLLKSYHLREMNDDSENDKVEIINYWENLKETTKSNYIYTYNHFVRDGFGKMKIGDIHFTDVKKFYYGLLEEHKVKANTLDNIHTQIHPTLQMAVRDDIIKKNPSDGVMNEIKRGRFWEKPKRHALTIPQQKAFMEFIQNSHEFRGWVPVITVLLGTGMRIGECLGLRWEDVDFENRIITVSHNLSDRPVGKDRKCERHIQTPKTTAGTRQIPVLDEVFEAFLTEYEIQKCLGFCQEEIDGYSGFIFSTAHGTLYQASAVNNALRRAREAYNKQEEEAAKKEGRNPLIIPPFSAHSLRHIFCTRFCENETNLKVIQDIMGHADISTTMDIYAEATQEKKQEVMANLQGKIF